MSSGNNIPEKNLDTIPFSKRLFDYFIFSNLFIAGSAVVMVNQTYQLFLQQKPNPDFLFFVFFSTLCSYSFHWWLTISSVLPSSRVRWLQKNKNVHLVLLLVGLTGCIVYFFRLIEYWPLLSIAAIVTFLYSAPKIPHRIFRSLRKVALGKTIFLALVWMIVTTALPFLISKVEWKTEFTLFILHRFFLIYAICILFDYRDRQDDIASGIKSLITYLNEKGIKRLFVFSLSVFFLSTILLYPFDFPVLTLIVLLLPGIITAFLYKTAMKNFSDHFYYFLLDGLMAFSSLLMLIPVNWLNLPS
jgi:4-hydroxybenzoate polyprenyltransferase